MVVGDNYAIGLDDHAGAQRGLLFGAVRHALAEELLEEGIAGKQAGATLDEALGIDIDHGAPRLLDQGRKRELHLELALRHSLVLRKRWNRERHHQGGNHGNRFETVEARHAKFLRAIMDVLDPVPAPANRQKQGRPIADGDNVCPAQAPTVSMMRVIKP